MVVVLGYVARRNNECPQPAPSQKETGIHADKTKVAVRISQEHADIELTQTFATVGISPNVLDNLVLKRALKKVALCGKSYDPLGRRQIRTYHQ